MLLTTRLIVVVNCDEATSRQRNERVITFKKRPRVGGSSTKKKKTTSLLHYIDMATASDEGTVLASSVDEGEGAVSPPPATRGFILLPTYPYTSK